MLLITRLAMLAASVVVGILVLIYGWGLSPVSWPWIVGGAAWSFVVLVAGSALSLIERESQ